MQQQQKKDIQILQTILKELPQGMIVRDITTLVARDGQEKVERIRQFRSDQNLGFSDIQILQKLRKIQHELGDDIEQANKDQIKNLINQFAPYYSVGCQFQKVIGIERINCGDEDSFTNEESSFQTENGVVYLVGVGVCLINKQAFEYSFFLQMYHNQKMLEKNPDWREKAKIVGIYLEDSTEYVAEYVNKNKWKLIEHYKLIEEYNDYTENDLIRFLEKFEHPWFLLVNKWGKIVYVGNAQEINLEDMINNEINAEWDAAEFKEEVKEKEQQNNEELLSKEQYKLLKKKLISIQAVINENDIDGLVCFNLSKINIWKPDGKKEVLKRSKLQIRYDIDVQEEEKLNKILEICNAIPENLKDVIKAIVRDPERYEKEVSQKFQEVFAALGVKISYPLQDYYKYYYEGNNQVFRSTSYSKKWQVEAQNLTSDLYKIGVKILNDYSDAYWDKIYEARNKFNIILSKLYLLSQQEPESKEDQVTLSIDPTQIQEILTTSEPALRQADPAKILEIEVELRINTEGGAVTALRPILSYIARDTQELQLQPVLSQLFNIIPEAQWIISKTISKTVSIPYPGKECAVCKKDITQEPQQYYSPFKSEHVCTECAEADDNEKKGNQRYKYLDALVFINGPLSDPSVLQNIDDHKLGSNMKLEDGDEGSQSHPMMCNGCGEGEKGPRYISITARPGRFQGSGYIDYCQRCFLQLKEKASEKAKRIVSKDVEEGMLLDSLFTRVLFNYGGYRDF